MTWQPPDPLSAASLTELRAALGTDDLLVGYDAVIDEAVGLLGTSIPESCTRSARSVDGRLVPSVVTVASGEILETWLDGETIGFDRRPVT